MSERASKHSGQVTVLEGTRQASLLQVQQQQEEEDEEGQHHQQQSPVAVKAEFCVRQACEDEQVTDREDAEERGDDADEDSPRRPAPPGLGAATLWAREAASLKRKMGEQRRDGELETLLAVKMHVTFRLYRKRCSKGHAYAHWVASAQTRVYSRPPYLPNPISCSRDFNRRWRRAQS